MGIEVNWTRLMRRMLSLRLTRFDRTRERMSRRWWCRPGRNGSEEGRVLFLSTISYHNGRECPDRSGDGAHHCLLSNADQFLFSHIVQSTHKCNFPGIQFQYFDTIENFIHHFDTLILQLHLLRLERSFRRAALLSLSACHLFVCLPSVSSECAGRTDSTESTEVVEQHRAQWPVAFDGRVTQGPKRFERVLEFKCYFWVTIESSGTYPTTGHECRNINHRSVTHR